MRISDAAGNIGSSYKARLMGKKAVIYIVCIFLCALSLFPFIIMFVNATRPSADIAQSLSLVPGNMLSTNWKTLNERQNFDFIRGMLNSLTVSTSATVLCLYVSLMTAYGITVYRFKGRNLVFTFIMVILMIPTQVSIIGFFNEMYSMGLINTFWPLIIPAAASPGDFPDFLQ
jgi:multiple sugar transport system permease protein